MSGSSTQDASRYVSRMKRGTLTLPALAPLILKHDVKQDTE